MPDLDETILEQKRIELEKLKVAQAISAKRWDALTKQETLTSICVSILFMCLTGVFCYGCYQDREYDKALIEKGLWDPAGPDGPRLLPERPK